MPSCLVSEHAACCRLAIALLLCLLPFDSHWEAFGARAGASSPELISELLVVTPPPPGADGTVPLRTDTETERSRQDVLHCGGYVGSAAVNACVGRDRIRAGDAAGTLPLAALLGRGSQISVGRQAVGPVTTVRPGSGGGRPRSTGRGGEIDRWPAMRPRGHGTWLASHGCFFTPCLRGARQSETERWRLRNRGQNGLCYPK